MNELVCGVGERDKMSEKGNPVRFTCFGVFRTCSVVLGIRKSPS